MLETTIDKILALDDLRPSDNVNELFTQLVQGVVAAPANATFDENLCRQVQRVASDSETEMELYWARKIIASPHPLEMLAQFPYCKNYEELVRREIGLLEQSGINLRTESTVLMVGTGPLPMTALELMRQRNVQIDHVDISEQALTLCGLVGQRLGLECGHIAGDGAKISFTRRYDVIIVAGLAGQTVLEKQAIIDNVMTVLKPAGRLLVRSSYGARSLLYPAVRATDFYGVELLEEYHPTDDVINSVFIYKQEADQ